MSVPWETLLEEIRVQAEGQIELDRFVELDSTHPGVTGTTLLMRSNAVMDSIKAAAGYRFKYVSFSRPYLGIVFGLTRVRFSKL